MNAINIVDVGVFNRQLRALSDNGNPVQISHIEPVNRDFDPLVVDVALTNIDKSTAIAYQGVEACMWTTRQSIDLAIGINPHRIV